MRRVWLVIASAVLVTVIGCGRENYEKRMQTTLLKLEKDRRIKKNLMEPPTEKKFQELTIYVRAPKDMALAKTGQLLVSEGQFDLDGSFNDSKADANLHVLARVKLPKKAAAKGAPPAPPPPQRGSFEADVLGVLANVFGSPEGLQTPKFVEESKGGNLFKRLIFNANDKEVKLYIAKQGNHEVALIFVYDPKLKGPLSSKIDLCLESFATGAKAGRLYTGGAAEDEAESGSPGPI
jgi:hypothetical protein